MKGVHKLDGPREETRKKMQPVTRAEFTALMEKAIRMAGRKISTKPPEAENPK